MMVSPTGSGKTVILSAILRELDAPACAIAHRQELIGQLALSLNREEIPHGIVAPKAIQQQIVTLEQELHGRSFYSPRAQTRVASVNTLPNFNATDPWLKQVQTVIVDEGHHVLGENVWGRAMAMFPAARGLFPTAHAIRGDGKGLGRGPSGDGLVDELVIGPCARDLINRGFLADYRLIAPPSGIHVEDIEVGDSGEYNQKKVRAAVHSSKTIVGDVVAHYLKFAAGKLGITFAVDIEAAGELAAKYRSESIPAEIITAKTPLSVRGHLMRQFRKRQIIQLVSVDVLSEGVDVPAVEVVSMARPTASFQLYSQQFGRALRPMIAQDLILPGPNGGTVRVWDNWGNYTDAERLNFIAGSPKPKAIIIDHVENYRRHGLPDVERQYSLNRAARKSKKDKSDDIPLRYCVNPECLQPYEAILNVCPACGTLRPAPMRRSTPEEVDGNCFELDPEVLHAMRKEQAKVDGPAPTSGNDVVARSIYNNHVARQEAQTELRKAMALWAGWQASKGRDGPEVQRTFFHKYGRDVMSAQVLGARDAEELRERIATELATHNIVEAT